MCVCVYWDWTMDFIHGSSTTELYPSIQSQMYFKMSFCQWKAETWLPSTNEKQNTQTTEADKYCTAIFKQSRAQCFAKNISRQKDLLLTEANTT